MKLTTVLTAVNNSPKYTRFIPVFIRAWRRLFPELKVRIVFIGSEIPTEFAPYSEHIVCFPEIPGVSSVYTAQTIRLLYPAVLPENEVTIITDIDMLPGSRPYYTEKLDGIHDDSFVVMRPKTCVGPGELAMCYNAASTKTWQDVFCIRSLDDIRSFLAKHYNAESDGIHGGIGWCTDQYLLHDFALRFPNTVMLDDRMIKRLDIAHHRYDMSTFVRMLNSRAYSDAHLYADGCPWTTAQLLLI
jgi:hypothetical protein